MIDEGKARYYTKDGAPAYDAGMKEAKDNGYGISVTSVTRQWSKPQLDMWKHRQTLLAALTLPRDEMETDESFIDRILEDSNAEGSAAAELGTMVHEAMEQFISRRTSMADAIPEGVRFSVLMAMDWADAMSLRGDVEQPFFHWFGFGGKRDVIGDAKLDPTNDLRQKVVVDWKTQFVKETNADGSLRATFYPEWSWQLGAYRLDTDVPPDNCFSVIISTNPAIPGIKIKQWPALHNQHANIMDGTKIFLSLLQTWQIMHHFPSPVLERGIATAA